MRTVTRLIADARHITYGIGSPASWVHYGDRMPASRRASATWSPWITGCRGAGQLWRSRRGDLGRRHLHDGFGRLLAITA